jgi:hypothetical protein
MCIVEFQGQLTWFNSSNLLCWFKVSLLLSLVSSELSSRVVRQVYGVGSLVHGYCGISKLSNLVP